MASRSKPVAQARNSLSETEREDLRRALEAAFARNSLVRVWDAAVQACRTGDPTLVDIFLEYLRRGAKPFHRRAAAYALGSLGDKRAVKALERVLTDKSENEYVRGEAAEALAYLFADRSIPLLRRCLADPSKEVRYWCVFALGVAGTISRNKARAALPQLRKLADSDQRKIIRGWRVADEAKWAIARLELMDKEADKLERRYEQECWGRRSRENCFQR